MGVALRLCRGVTHSGATCTEPPGGPAAPQRDVPPTASGCNWVSKLGLGTSVNKTIKRRQESQEGR